MRFESVIFMYGFELDKSDQRHTRNDTHLELVDHLRDVLQRHVRGHLDGVHLDVEGLFEPPAQLYEAEGVEPQRRELRCHQHVGGAW